MRTRMSLTIALLLALAVPAYAADHIDSPAAIASPAADITDLYAWMSADGNDLNLAMNVFPFAGQGASFSTDVVYGFHISSLAAYGGDETTEMLLCKFYKSSGDGIECWLGDQYVVGDPSDPAGITSTDGSVRVFAGPRNDPFFFNLTGFENAVGAVAAAAGGLQFDDEMCPAVGAETSAAVVGLLQSGDDGAPAADNFAGANVLSIVVQVDRTLINAGGDFLAVWAGTYQAN